MQRRGSANLCGTKIMTRCTHLLATLAIAVSCGGTAAPPENATSTPTSTAAAPSDSPAASSTGPSSNAQALSPSAPCAGEDCKPSVDQGAQPKTAIPASFKPPFERTAEPGDGTWTAMAEAGNVDGAPVMYRSTLHPARIRRDVSVALVAMDVGRISVHLVAGTEEPKTQRVPEERRRGLVPEQDQADLIAVFNGGFQTEHGRWGSMIDGEVLVPPRDEGCTVALNKDGSIAIGMWPSLEAKRPEMNSFRQAPPCLVEGGKLHPDLEAKKSLGKWAMSKEGKKDIRRSAVGIDASRKLFFFGLGEWTAPEELALAMQIAGAEQAIQLDVNWIWTKFLFYGRAGDGTLEVSSTLVPEIRHGKKSYVKSASARDFFYVKRRSAKAP
jgi:hypothetical protein